MSALAILAVCPKVEPLPPWRINSPIDMGSVLWTNCKYKDFQIVVGDRVLDVHKCVLAARSQVFAAMLISDVIRDQSGQLIIQNFDFDVVLCAIWFLYSDRFVCNYSTPFICDLLRFGHKYDIQILIKACIRQINDLRDSYDSSEKKFLIKSADDLGSNQILNSILIIFGAKIEGQLLPYTSPSYYTEVGVTLGQTEIFKNFKIICSGQEFSVHKCILALKSPVFDQMFDTMAANGDTSGRLVITGIKSTVFEKAVSFFYTGHITITSIDNNLYLYLGILEFADKFKVKELVSLCLKEINNAKNNLGQEENEEIKTTCLKTAIKFQSEKIFHLILEIFETPGFEPFEFKKSSTSKESYWN